MEYLAAASYPIWINVAIFTGSAVLVWAAGSRIARYANTLAERTGLGRAMLGILLLGGVTSLPEVAVSATAAAVGNAPLAVNNLLGGVAMQVTILALADAALGKDALSSVVPRPAVLLQATFGILLLTLVVAGITLGGAPLGSAELGMARLQTGGWSAAILIGGITAIWLVQRYEEHPAWVPHAATASGLPEANLEPTATDGITLSGLWSRIAVTGSVILVAGYFLARTGAQIAEQTGLGSSFVGAVLVGTSTSLPEVSTVLAAVRLRQYEMAISDIFGTNLIDLCLIFLVDLIYLGPPVLGTLGDFAVVAALLGITLNGIYLAGLIERRDRTIARMGWDSFLVLLVYLAGLVLLFRLR